VTDPALRTLPTRVTPLPGESIDSWLEAYAARLDGSVGDLLVAAGLFTKPDDPAPRSEPPDHTVYLLDHDAERIAAITGVTVPRLHAMTLRVFDRHAVSLDTDRRAPAGQAARRLPGHAAGFARLKITARATRS
jgi:hypothetical protein